MLNTHSIRHEIHRFDSGAMMVDIWIGDDFYVIQLTDEYIGFSKIDNESGFDTRPDEVFENEAVLIERMRSIV